MFQFRRFPSYTYFIQYMIDEVCSSGLLHSEICGSKCTYHSPQLIAVNHVLLRLPMPRHSPCALYCFTICFMFWVLVTLVVFYPIKFLLSFLTRSILICITFCFIQFSSFFSLFLRTDFNNQISLIIQIYSPDVEDAVPYISDLWWAQMDSNHRPHAYQACALTTWAMRPFFGGDEEDRTPDPLRARQMLSQLSYTPNLIRNS